MSGNLIDNRVNLYRQQNTDSSSNNSGQSVQYPSATNPQAPDSFESTENAKKEPNGALCTLAAWLGLNTLSELFNKSCSKADYNKTIIGRLGNLGDTISAKASQNRIITSIKGFFDATKANVKGYIDKKPALSAIFNTPTKPECSQVISFMETQHTADLNEAVNTIKTYMDDLPRSFKEAGATKAEILALKSKYGTNAFGGIKNKTKAIMELQFNRAGAPAGFIDTLAPDKIAEALKEAKIKSLGFADKAAYEAAIANPKNYANEIEQACQKGGKAVKAIFGRGLGIITKRSTNLAMSENKLLAETKHASKLGKFMAKAPKVIMRGLTFGGGRISALLVAVGLGTAIKNTIQAPKKQKVATAASGGVDAVSWIVSIPLAIKAMYSINGAKYLGMGKDAAELKANVSQYRTALKAFNLDQKAGKLTNKTTYLRRLAELNKMKESKIPLSKFQKFIKKFADKALGVGLEVPRPYQAATEGLTGKALSTAKKGNLKRMAGFLAKNGIAYPLRLAAYALIFSPIVDKLISTCTRALFGKPYEPPEENDEAQQDANSEQDVKPIVNQQSNNPDIESLPDDNLIKRGVHGEKIMHDKYIPSEDCNIPMSTSPHDAQNRSYIPGEDCTIPYDPKGDMKMVDEAIEFDKQLKERAYKTLNGNF